jgi:hypothetical protein
MKKTTAWLSMEKFDNRPLNSVGTSRIRVRWLLNYWPEAEEYVIGKKYQILLYNKVYWGNMMRNFKGIQVIDIPDPDWLEGKPVMEFVDLCDAVTTSTQALADYIQKLRPKALVKCIPDRVYIPDHKPVKKRHTGVMKKVGWIGYSHNIHYIVPTFDDLIKYGIELTVISNNPYDPPLIYRNKLKLKNVPYNYGNLFKECVRLDAMLYPKPKGDERAKFKSDNKTTQAKAQGLPVITLPEDLKRFMKPEERKRASLEGLKEVKEIWDCKISVREMRALIKECKKRRKK